ncbi:phosphate ABC transporter permease PstA [Candidatus Bathyarchaeota archaeon]|nr:phosphate ABC transporter permease PstA [Candidatus Bathyarchaeota archaeon]
MHKRRLEEGFFQVLMVMSTFIILGSFISVLVVVILRGAPALSISMLTQTPKGGYYLGKEGGVLNAIVGSLYLVGGATMLAFAISFPTALYLNEYAQGSKLAGLTRQSLDVLWGVPSILYGVFGFIIMIQLGMRASLFGGIIALTLLELPIMTRAMDEVMKMTPFRLREASYALGATKLETALNVIARQSMPGVTMGVMLALGRAIGDAASVLFTAGYADEIPRSLFDPVASLPLAVFFQIGTPFPEVQQRAYASAFILLVVVLSLSISSRFVTRRLMKHVIK